MPSSLKRFEASDFREERLRSFRLVLVSQIYGLLKGDKDKMQLLLNRFLIIIGFIFIFQCVFLARFWGDFAKEKARLDSLKT